MASISSSTSVPPVAASSLPGLSPAPGESTGDMPEHLDFKQRLGQNEYVTIKRDELANEFDLEVDIATAEVDNAKSQDLGFMLQTMGPKYGSSNQHAAVG